MGTILALTALASVAAGPPQSCAFPSDISQPASLEDMKGLMGQYIGTFRSPTKRFDNSEKQYFFTIEYSWFDTQSSIARWEVKMVIPEDDRVIPRGEGYYGFDPVLDRIYIFAVFSTGNTGRGEMGVFDIAEGSRSVWAKSTDANGVTTYVQDMFEPVKGEGFRNRTKVCRSDNGQWQEVAGDVYSRIEAD